MAYSNSTAECPSCRNKISVTASVCPFCTSKIIKVSEPGIMNDERVPQKIKKILKYAPLACATITFLYFSRVTNKGFIEWAIIILATLGVYIFVHIFLRMRTTHNKTKD